MSLPSELLPVGLLGTGVAAEEGYSISRSVRFNSSDSAYLSRGSFANSDTKTMTFSFWLKRSAPTSVTATQYIFSGGDNGTIFFGSGTSDKLTFNLRGTSGSNFFTNTEAELRDFSAWYHIVVALDLDNVTTSERFKCYINGVQQTMSSTSYPNNNFHDGGTWYIGSYTGTQYYPDFYLADFYYIAGQALDPTDFGEFDATTGIWNPIEYTGSYGTNGFHLDFSDNSSATALGTDTSGAGNDWTPNNFSVSTTTANYSDNSQITGSGTSGWVANKGPEVLFDGDLATFTDQVDSGSTGVSAYMYWNPTTAVPVSSSLRIYGRWYVSSIGNQYLISDEVSINGNPYVAPGDGTTSSQWVDLSSYLSTYSITSITNITWRSNPTSGNRLEPGMAAIEVDGSILVNSSASNNDSLVDSPTNGDQEDTGAGGEVVGNYATLNPLWGGTSLTNGNLESTLNATRPAALASIAPSSGKWYFEVYITGTNPHIGLFDEAQFNTSTNTSSYIRGSDGSKVGLTGGTFTFGQNDLVQCAVDFDGGTIQYAKNGGSYSSFTITNTNAPNCFMGFLYQGIANFGQRPFAYTAPSGFKALCTTNLDDPTIADGSTAMDAVLYSGTGSAQTISGLNFSPDFVWTKCRSFARHHALIDVIRGGDKLLGSSNTTADATYTDMITAFNSDGFTLGADATTLRVNESGRTYVAWAWDAGTSNTSISAGSLNSSAYNQDQNWGPGSTVTGSWAFSDTVNAAFDGDLTTVSRAASSQATTIDLPADVAFTSSVKLTASVDNAGGQIYIKDGTNAFVNVSSGFNASSTVNTVDITSLLTSPIKEIKLDSVGNGYARMSGIEVDGKLLVSSSATPPVNVPTIASTVRANASAGFSIVTWTGNGVAGASVGHGLSVAPTMIITKDRDAAKNWCVYHVSIGATNILLLNTTAASAAGNNYNDTTPTSTVFYNHAGNPSFGSQQNINGNEYVSYCFAPVEGYSAFGSYTGNGSADGPFVYTGFRPRYVLYKRTDSTGEWAIWDTSRNPSNVTDKYLWAQSSNAEGTFGAVDILSNGFKLRTNDAANNASNGTFIYAAFAENPLALNARAR